MEDVYINVDQLKRTDGVTRVTQPSLNSGIRQNSSKRSIKRWHLCASVFLGLLSVFLLTGLVVNCVLNHGLTDIRQNLTERLETSNLQISSLTEERNQLKANVTKMSEDMAKLHTLLSDVCLTGWKKFRRSCYLFSAQSGSWDEAREDCKQRGADLVVIESAEEKDFLAGIIKKYTWIGLNDREQEGIWKWVNGAPLNYTFWEKIQPDDWKGEEDCVHIADHFMWNDLSCSSSNLWICERKAGQFL